MFKKRIFTALVLSLFVAATLIVCWPLVEPVYARTIAVVTDNLGNFTGPQTGAAQNDNVKGSLDLMHGKILPSANATCWYVDSGISGQTAGDSWSTAVATIEAAVALASAEDWILVAPGHNEAMEAADEIDLDKAGLVLLGFGNGAKKPTLDYDNANGELVIGADSVTVQNIRFRVS
ncbi:MAG: hypothetical protein GWN55_10510, partial [Phycisphaerae bacterium]|nr:hypothetical protein [Phycisphaerae bacterium]NIV01733.1 hypothetical protein [Phycisphaerae bacterium]NIX00631.1 hypothetical protein [Phycisphaerae bacterium]